MKMPAITLDWGLDEDQKKGFELIIMGRSVFLTGSGGCGKSHLLRAATEELSARGVETAITATTGTAVVNLGIRGARTIDSYLGIYPKIYDLVDYCLYGKTFGMRFFQTSQGLLAIDEVSMATYLRVDLFYQILNVSTQPWFVEQVGALQNKHKNADSEGKLSVKRDLMQLCARYQSVIYRDEFQPVCSIILLGDLCQLGPVDKPKVPGELFHCRCWAKLSIETVTLTRQHRQGEGSALLRALSLLRMGVVNQEVIAIIRECSRPLKVPSVHLFATNREKDRHNQEQLTLLKKRARTYRSKDTYTPYAERNLDEFQALFRTSAVLKLKVGSNVMLLQNIDLDRGLVNGSTGTVRELHSDGVSVLFVNGVVRKVEAHREEIFTKIWDKRIQKEVIITNATRKQIPLTLADGLTIHKIQGQTLQSVTVHCQGIWEAGQLYTALSRATHVEGLSIEGFQVSQAKPPSGTIRRFYEQAGRPKLERPTVGAIYNLLKARQSLVALEEAVRSSQSEVRSATIRLRNELLRRRRSGEMSPGEEQFLAQMQAYLGVSSDRNDDDLLYINCPRCNAILDERHLLQCGAYCGCGQTQPKDVLRAITVKYGWVVYIIQRPSLTLTDPVTYVGVSTRGDARLREHYRDWLSEFGDCIIRCTLRLSETVAIAMFRPDKNKYLRGGGSDSNALRLGGNEVFFGVTDPYQSRPVSVQYKDVFNTVTEPHLSCGIITPSAGRLPSENDRCLRKDSTICRCGIKCWLRSVHNQLMGRPRYHPLTYEEVAHRAPGKAEKLPPQPNTPVTEWDRRTAVTVAQRRRNTRATRLQAASSTGALWHRGMLNPELFVRPWELAQRSVVAFGPKNAQQYLSDLMVLLSKLSPAEHVFVVGYRAVGQRNEMKGHRAVGEHLIRDFVRYLEMPRSSWRDGALRGCV
jgi:hypothetical protein